MVFEPIPFVGWVEIPDLEERVVCELSVILPKQIVKRNDCVVCYDRHCKYYVPIKVLDYEVLK